MNSRLALTQRFAAAGLAAGVAILLAACGSSQKPQATGSSGPGHGSGATAAYHFSACMREHGVSNFQDPRVSSRGNQVQIAIHVDPAITSSPDFKSAQHACAHILPGGMSGPTQVQRQAHTEAILAFARCMREHGFPQFPDPDSGGQLTLAMITRAGIDLEQPAVKPAAYACAPLTHGILTRADINQALANPNATGNTVIVGWASGDSSRATGMLKSDKSRRPKTLCRGQCTSHHTTHAEPIGT